MNILKRHAWYGSAVVASFAVAMALLFAGPAGTAQAAAITGISIGITAANPPIAGSQNGAAQVVATFTTATTIPVAAGNIYTITFPTGTTFSTAASTAANWTIAANTGTATITAVSTSSNVLTITATQTVTADTGGVHQLTGVAAGLVTYPSVATTTGSVTVATASAGPVALDTGTTATQAIVAPAPAPAPASFASTPLFSVGKLAQVVFNGGTVAQLDTALTANGATGAWAQDRNGVFVLYIVNGGFVNDGFKAAFPNGFAGIAPLVLVGK